MDTAHSEECRHFNNKSLARVRRSYRANSRFHAPKLRTPPCLSLRVAAGLCVVRECGVSVRVQRGSGACSRSGGYHGRCRQRPPASARLRLACRWRLSTPLTHTGPLPFDGAPTICRATCGALGIGLGCFCAAGGDGGDFWIEHPDLRVIPF